VLGPEPTRTLPGEAAVAPADRGQFAYDANGNLLSVTDARNNATTSAYNSMDRVTTRTDPLTRAENLRL